MCSREKSLAWQPFSWSPGVLYDAVVYSQVVEHDGVPFAAALDDGPSATGGVNALESGS